MTVRVKAWVDDPLVLLALIDKGYAPTLAEVRVPVTVVVPLPLSLNVTPEGRVPDLVSAGTGLPEVVTVKVVGWPTVKVVEAALVIRRRAAAMFSVKAPG